MAQLGKEELFHHNDYFLHISGNIFLKILTIVLLKVGKQLSNRLSVLEKIESSRDAVSFEIVIELLLFLDFAENFVDIPLYPRRLVVKDGFVNLAEIHLTLTDQVEDDINILGVLLGIVLLPVIGILLGVGLLV